MRLVVLPQQLVSGTRTTATVDHPSTPDGDAITFAVGDGIALADLHDPRLQIVLTIEFQAAIGQPFLPGSDPGNPQNPAAEYTFVGDPSRTTPPSASWRQAGWRRARCVVDVNRPVSLGIDAYTH